MADKTDAIPAKNVSTDQAVDDPAFVFSEDGKRVGVDDYGKDICNFWPGDKVYLCSSGTQEGPYTIERAKDGKYTLCNDQGDSVKDGKEFEESELTLYNQF